MINEEFNFLEDISEHANSPKKTKYTPNSNFLKNSKMKVNIQICNKGHNLFEIKNKINSKENFSSPAKTKNNSKVFKSPKQNKIQKQNKNIKTPDVQPKNKVVQSYKYENEINSGKQLKFSPQKKQKLRKNTEIEKKVTTTENDYNLTEPNQNFEDSANINKTLKRIAIKPKKLNLVNINNKINSMDNKEYNKAKKLKEQKFKKFIQDLESKEKNGQEISNLSSQKVKKPIKINNRINNLKINKEGKINNDKIEGNLSRDNAILTKEKNIKNLNKYNKAESSTEEKNIKANILKQKNEMLEELSHNKIYNNTKEIKEKEKEEEEEKFHKKNQIKHQSSKNKEKEVINNIKGEEAEVDNKKVEIKMKKRIINKRQEYKLKSNENNKILKNSKKPKFIQIDNNIKSTKSSEINSCANSVKKFSSNSSHTLFQKNSNKSKDKYKKYITKPIRKYNLKLKNFDSNKKMTSRTIQPMKINLTDANYNGLYYHSKSHRNNTTTNKINLFMEEREKQKKEKKSLSDKNKDKVDLQKEQLDSHLIKKCTKKKFLEKNNTNYLLNSTSFKKNIIKLDNDQNETSKMYHKLSNSNSEKKGVKLKREKINQFKENKFDLTENLNEIIKKYNHNNSKKESKTTSNKKILKLQPNQMLLNTNEENDHQKNKVIFNTEEIRGPKLDNQKIIHSKREEKEKKKGNENETHEAKEKEKEKEKQKIEKKPDSKEKNKFQNNIEDKVKEIKKIELKDKLKSLDKLSKEAKRDTIKVKSNGHSQRSTRNIIPEKNSINESKYTLNKINSNKNKIIYTHINDEYKRSFSENSYKEERVLISNFKSHFALSKAGKDDSGNIKINQDSYVIITRINNLKDFNIFGVLDGHGPEGHLVSQFISKYLEVEFHNISGIKKLNDTEKIYSKLSSNDFEIIKKIIINADIALKDQDIDSRTSGTTCVLVIHVGEHIICANTGDSRAVLVFDEKDDEELNYLKVFPLSIDSKPEIPSEKERIINSGGDVEKIRNKFGQLVGPYRVWVKNKDYPGLAMSRSIGDFNAKVVGVIPNPEIIECNLSIYSKYIVICSDGVWEFLSNEDVMNVGKKYYLEGNPKGFCKKLVENSIKFWEKEDIVIDDITVVTIFF